LASAGGRDRHRQRTGADDRRQDEVAQRRHVDDVDQHRARLGVLEHADVEVGVVGRGDRDQRAVEIRRAGVLTLFPPDRALERKLRELGMGLGCDQGHVGVAGEQALDLLEPDVTAADDHAPPAAQPQARDVERRLEHALDARLVARAATQLTNALFTAIGLSGHL
jgi:hypothetical protein